MSFKSSYLGDTILVSGATGRQGNAVVHHLLGAGWKVRALTRAKNSVKAQQLVKAGASIVEGNFDDKVSLIQALDGVHGVFSVQTFWEAGIEAEIRHGKNLADAAKLTGVKHFVYSSALYADTDTRVPHWKSKTEIEAYIHMIGLPATIFRPASFMENFLRVETLKLLEGGKICFPLRPLCIRQYLALDDLGAFVLKAFENPLEFIGEEIYLAGDELNMNELTNTFSRILERDLQYVPMPRIVSRFRLGKEYYKMFKWLDKRKLDDMAGANISELRRQNPSLMRLEDWLLNKKHLFFQEYFPTHH